MVTGTALGWRDLKAEMTRCDVRVYEVAAELGWGSSRFSMLLSSEDETKPLPAFADRVLEAIEAVARKKAETS